MKNYTNYKKGRLIESIFELDYSLEEKFFMRDSLVTKSFLECLQYRYLKSLIENKNLRIAVKKGSDEK